MIIVKLMGGLGNQLFQYAAGKSLAHLRNTVLKTDLSFLEADTKGAYTKRNYELGVFALENKFATKSKVAPFLEKGKSRLARVAGRLFPSFSDKMYAAESGHDYQTGFINFPADTYLDGFWQSEKYFAGIEEIIRKDFTFKTAPEGKNLELANKIKSVNALSLHVRRGDYVKNKAVMEFHGTCSPEYYAKSVKYISAKIKDLHLFIFSDDADWCRQNLVFDLPSTYIDHNTGDKSYEDMRLMSLCKHHIIANSSFSWWGAWLNPSKEKIVIAPAKWFAAADHQANDIYPSTWIKL